MELDSHTLYAFDRRQGYVPNPEPSFYRVQNNALVEEIDPYEFDSNRAILRHLHRYEYSRIITGHFPKNGLYGTHFEKFDARKHEDVDITEMEFLPQPISEKMQHYLKRNGIEVILHNFDAQEETQLYLI